MPEGQKRCLVIVDVQGKLARVMYNAEKLLSNILIMVKAAKILNIPIIWCQQNPQALGETVGEIAEQLADKRPINKMSFSCAGEAEFVKAIEAINPSEVLLVGIESHVCICQTAIDLMRMGIGVSVIADAVSSRTAENREMAIERMKSKGAEITTTEMLLFELLRTAEHSDFRQIAKLVK